MSKVEMVEDPVTQSNIMSHTAEIQVKGNYTITNLSAMLTSNCEFQRFFSRMSILNSTYHAKTIGDALKFTNDGHSKDSQTPNLVQVERFTWIQSAIAESPTHSCSRNSRNISAAEGLIRTKTM
jgi:hypothetical protein